MTDIVKSLKEAVCLPDTGCMSVVTCVCDIMQDAADEIERLNQSIKWEQNRAGRIGTHAPGCWGWGHQHYECALQEVKRLTNEISSLRAGVQASEVIQPSPEKMLKAEEAFAFLGVPRSTFYANVKMGHLPQPYYVTKGSPRWKLEELQAAKKGIKK